MMRHLLLTALALTGTFCLALSIQAQPVPKEGTEMVPNEHGGHFPREIVWEKDGAEMVLIPYGTFTRGLSAERGGSPAERPEREIHLPSFYIDKYEVSNRRYLRYVEDAGGARPRPSGNPDLREPDHPVTAIPWDSASGYARWAGKSLPTEAMWEKAARGAEGFLFTTGNTPPDTETVIYGRGGFGTTVPVTEDTGDVSPYGVHHMGGNASEWVSDWYERDYYQVEVDENPKGPSSGLSKSIRGGSYLTPRAEIRATFRHVGLRTQIRDEVGFRTVWVPSSPREVASVTPTPTPAATLAPREARARTAERYAGILEPYLRDRLPELPREMMATQAHMSRGRADVQFVNFTPWELSLSFVGPDQDVVFRYAEPLPRMNYRNVTLPREVDLTILAYAYGAPRKGPINLGFVRAESNAIIVINTELFGPVDDYEAGEVPIRERTTAPQHYSGFTAQWNQLEVFNSVEESLLVRIEDVTRSLEDPDLVGDYTVEPGTSFRIRLAPGRYRFAADYFGASEASSNVVTFRLDDRAARRLLHIQEDAARQDRVVVITQRRPFLAIDLYEARRLPQPRSN